MGSEGVGEVLIPKTEIEGGSVPVEAPVGEVVFPETVLIEACSRNKCGRGHTWPIAVGVAKCPGCGSPVLAVKMENCPICNEPATVSKIRTDYLPAGGPIAAVCRQQRHPVVVTEAIEIQRTHAEETETKATAAAAAATTASAVEAQGKAEA